MPQLTIPSMTRRNFAWTLAGGSVAVLGAAKAEIRWALLSDTHIPADPEEAYRGFKPCENLKRIVPQVVEREPEGVLICGDIARLAGLPADYERVKSIAGGLLESMPVAMALGNHDHRANFVSAFGKMQKGMQAVRGRHVLVVETSVARFVVLDSLVEANSTPGFLGKIQREWLDGYLRSVTDLPTLIFVHHTLDDNDGALHDAPRLFEVVKRHPKVKAIVYGHSHNYAYDLWEGVHLINLPAVGYNFNDREPVGWVDAALTLEGGTFTLRAFGGNMEKNGKSTNLTWRK